MIMGAIKLIQEEAGSALKIEDLKIIGLVFIFIFLSGLLLSLISTFLAVKKYIQLKEKNLYN